MILNHTQYMEKFSATDSDKSPFHRHLDVCGIKTKNDKKTRARKFLWGIRKGNDTTWTDLRSMSVEQLEYVKGFLSNYAHSFEDEQIAWIFDLVDFTIENQSEL